MDNRNDNVLCKLSPENNSELQNSPTRYVPTIVYSIEEEKWIQLQLEKFDFAFKKIPLGDELIKEVLMYSLGVPLSKSFMANNMAVYLERYLMVMKIHPEFNNLSPSRQQKLWKANSILSLGVLVSKMEACQTGCEQLAFGMGNEEKSWIFEKAQNKKLKKLTMDMANVSTGTLSKAELENFGRSVKAVGELIQDDETFKLFTLAVLFSVEQEECSSPEMGLLKNTYLNIIRRRTSYLSHKVDDGIVEDLTFGQLVYSRFSSCVSSVKDVAMFCQKVMGIN